MLDRYEHDERIVMVSGFNSEERIEGCPYDYLFTSVMSIWGWASWRRVVDRWDGKYSFLDDEYDIGQLRALMRQRKMNFDTLRACYDHRASGREYYETILWAAMLFGSGLAIVPTRNLINNLGATQDSTHYAGSLALMPHRLRRMFTMPRYELEWPLRHPRYVIENVEYKGNVLPHHGIRPSVDKGGAVAGGACAQPEPRQLRHHSPGRGQPREEDARAGPLPLSLSPRA